MKEQEKLPGEFKWSLVGSGAITIGTALAIVLTRAGHSQEEKEPSVFYN